jgi:hypothetical protein
MKPVNCSGYETLNLKKGYSCEIRKEIAVTVVLFQSCPESSRPEIRTRYLSNKKQVYESLDLLHMCAE